MFMLFMFVEPFLDYYTLEFLMRLLCLVIRFQLLEMFVDMLYYYENVKRKWSVKDECSHLVVLYAVLMAALCVCLCKILLRNNAKHCRLPNTFNAWCAYNWCAHEYCSEAELFCKCSWLEPVNCWSQVNDAQIIMDWPTWILYCCLWSGHSHLTKHVFTPFLTLFVSQLSAHPPPLLGKLSFHYVAWHWWLFWR